MRANHFKPYVRRANGKEEAKGFLMDFRSSFPAKSGKPCYVMVQHGFPNLAIAWGFTKREVQQRPLLVSLRKVSFKQWANDIKHRAQKGGRP